MVEMTYAPSSASKEIKITTEVPAPTIPTPITIPWTYIAVGVGAVVAGIIGYIIYRSLSK
jgi:hypothetical protein